MSELVEFAPGIWVCSEPMGILGTRLTASMAVVDVGDGRLLLYSPIALTDARRAAVEACGTVAHLYAPNTFHRLSIGDWADAFPDAKVHAPNGLARKRTDLRVDRTHDREPDAELATACDEVPIEGFLLEETVLIHRASRTLLVADLVHNIGRPAGWWTKTYSTLMGFYDRVAISRAIRWTAFRNRAAARSSIDRLIQHDFDRMIVGHGTPIETDAKQALLEAYRWLEPRRPLLQLPAPSPKRPKPCG